MKSSQAATIRNLSCIFLGLVFFTSGMSKLYFEHQFVGIIGPVWLEKELAQYGLGIFARFIGYAQVSIGFLLLTIRYSTLGAVMLIPLVTNILLVTISLHWRGTPYVVAILLLMNIFVIWADRKKLLPIVTGNSQGYSERKQSLRGVLTWIAGFTLTLASINISYISLPIGYVMVVVGIGFALLSLWMDRGTL